MVNICNSRNTKHCWILLLVLLLTGNLQAAVSAKVDKNPVLVNESFVFEVTSDQSLSGDEFDRTDLLALFKVGRTSVSRQTRIVNGQSSQSTVWSTILLADKAGEYLIPSLDVGGETTAPISVTIIEGQPSQEAADLFLNTKVSRNEIYLGQEIILDVKLYYANALQRGSLSEPKIESSEIEQIGEDAEATEIINGRRYRVIIRKYRISPKASGEFRLSSPFFEGEVATSNNNSFFQGFNTGRAVSTTGEDHNILVNAIPEHYQGYWLPSESVTLEENWQMPANVFPGEPITRKISLVALGVSKQQLPELKLAATREFSIYPDQAERVTGELSGLPAAQLTQSFAIIANRSGDLIVPEVRVPWWDTRAKKQRWATLPARTIKIGNVPNENAGPKNGEVTNTQTQLSADLVTDLTRVPASQLKSTAWLQWLFLVLWLLTLLGWWLSTRKQTEKSQANNVSTNPASTAAWSKLKTACDNNDGAQILSNLLLWSNELQTKNNRENLHNLSAIKAYFDEPELNSHLDGLQASLYGESSEDWSGKAILILLKKHKPRGSQEILTPLN